MGNNCSIFSKEEIVELEEMAKKKEWHKLVDFSIKKYENGFEISRIHAGNSNNNINYSDSELNPYSHKIKLGKKTNETIGVALALYTIGVLSDAETNYIDIRNKKRKLISTKHSENHSREDITEALNIIHKCHDDYILMKEAGVPYSPDYCEDLIVDDKTQPEEIKESELKTYMSISKPEKEKIESYVKKTFLKNKDISVSNLIEKLENNKGVKISRTPIDKWKKEIYKILEKKNKRLNELWDDSIEINLSKDSQDYSILFGNKNVSNYDEKIPKGSYVLEEILENTEIKDGDIITTKRLKIIYSE